MRLSVPEHRLNAAALFTLLLLLLNMYALRLRPLADAVMLCVGAVALLAVLADTVPRDLLRRLLTAFAACALYLLAGAVISADVTLRQGLSGIHGLLMIGCFLVFMQEVLRSQGAERLLRLLFLAGAASAVVSVAVHLATTQPLAVRLIPFGRPGNPIPAAAAMAAATLAGLALFRMSRPSGPWRAAHLAAIGAGSCAVILSQSRGPLIGLAVGTLLLILPRRPAWLMLSLPPIIFLGASSLVVVEGWVRALLCTSEEGMLCRPSLRLPLWERAVALIAEHPLTGMGTAYQLGTGWLNNPQNALISTALYFGLPFALACMIAAALLLRRLATAPEDLALLWSKAMIGFSAIYYAFEPNPFAFYNAHYLALWMPVAFILRPREAAGSPPPPASYRHSAAAPGAS